MFQPVIHDVTDTAFWVAAYRALESERPDALFQDPFALRLTGDQGLQISKRMLGSKYVSWSVVLRTWIIDRFIDQLLAEGVDTILNLGAGLDSRPYRMNLPPSLRWIEVDFPRIIKLKEERLKNDRPNCKLERFPLDLSQKTDRIKIFLDAAHDSKKTAILTEGVIPYLSNEEVATLANELHSQIPFEYWIVDYFSPKLMSVIQKDLLKNWQLKNAPLRFLPENWEGFFSEHKWTPYQTQYLITESLKLGRALPIPFWESIFSHLIPAKKLDQIAKQLGYVILKPIRF
jgi:methyltransferase (TIGR00027 family)